VDLFDKHSYDCPPTVVKDSSPGTHSMSRVLAQCSSGSTRSAQPKNSEPMSLASTPSPLRVIHPPAETSEGKLVYSDELKAELAAASQSLETASPEEILRWAVEHYAPKFTMATAFGPEGMVLIHMLAEIAPDTPIFNLDT